MTDRRSGRGFPAVPSLPSKVLKDSNNATAGQENHDVMTPFRSKQRKAIKTPNSARVLRTAETMESLFLLNDSSSRNQIRLCQQIVGSTNTTNDAALWRRLLDSYYLPSFQNNNNAELLMRLYRRAKSRFPLDNHNGMTQDENVIQIWLLYAQAQLRLVSHDECQSTIKHLQKITHQHNNTRLLQQWALYYKLLAQLQTSCLEEQRNILKEGIKQQAHPVSDLERALQQLASRSNTASTSGSDGTSNRKLAGATPKRRKHDDDMSTGTISLDLVDRKVTQSTTTANTGAKESIFRPKPTPVTATTTTTMKKESSIVDKGVSLSRPMDVVVAKVPPIVERRDAVKNQDKPDHPTDKQLKRKSILSSSSRFKSAGLTGRAKRLAPNQAQLLEDTDDEDDESKDLRDLMLPPPSHASNNNNKAQPMKKLDLSYMMNWDPNKRDLTSNNTKTTNKPPSMRPITETAELSSSTNSKHTSSTGGSSHSNNTTSSTLHSAVTEAAAPATPSPAILARCNADFLPLVQENNILRVNQVPYLKLGVIGKGGSSKVYRALTRECQVVAIKKVRLTDCDRKAIDGYANEIALLKKLAGNPYIIQCHDSQVEVLNRKAIFLVMELGEVDLSQVLQQQQMAGSSSSNKQLNMNFIRLTWQQMLSAVHSIHQERIIHSDLKPANFLFVRGCLKLIDFGIAKAISGDDTTNIYRDSQIGTLNYISPEAILDTGGGGGEGPRMRIGRASDIWSLGCILYQMVYGKTPFASLHMIPKLQAIINPNYEISYPATSDPAAVNAIQLCLQRTPEDRPPIVGQPNGLLDCHVFLHSKT